jgi:hypothetical protein
MALGSDTIGTGTQGVDQDPSQRPGVPKERKPERWPNALHPPEPMRSTVKVFNRIRPHGTMPPVYGTAQPPHGVSGRLREVAYRYPDHVMRHWTMLLVADRVDVWERRVRRVLPFALPLVAVGIAAVVYRAVARR